MTRRDDSGAVPFPTGPAVPQFSDEEELTPVCTNLVSTFWDHWNRHFMAYEDFHRRLHLEPHRPKKISITQPAGKFIKSIQEGSRRICWCPKGVTLLGMGLFPYFAVQKTLISWEVDGDSIPPPSLSGMPAVVSEEAWIAYTGRKFSDEGEYRERLRDSQYPKANSDFFLKVSLPSAVQMAYLVGWLLEQQDEEILSLVSSPNLDNPVFFRTSTRPSRSTVIGMAYVPDQALIFRGFKAEHEFRNLKTLDAFLLI